MCRPRDLAPILSLNTLHEQLLRCFLGAVAYAGVPRRQNVPRMRLRPEVGRLAGWRLALALAEFRVIASGLGYGP